MHVHAKHYKHNEDGRTAPGVFGNGSVPLSHSGNVVTRIGLHTFGDELAFHRRGLCVSGSANVAAVNPASQWCTSDPSLKNLRELFSLLIHKFNAQKAQKAHRPKLEYLQVWTLRGGGHIYKMLKVYDSLW